MYVLISLLTACGLHFSGVVALFGPDTSPEASASVQGVCENMDVPHIQTVWERDDVEIPKGTVSLNLFHQIEI